MRPSSFTTQFCPSLVWTYFFYSVGRPKHVRVMAGALEGDLFIGPKAEVMVPGALEALEIFFPEW